MNLATFWAGKLITLEGGDGAGTTSQLEPLANHLRDQGYRCLTTCQPSRGIIGQQIRQVLRGKEILSEAALALLFAADRLAHLSQEIIPFIKAGGVVICDRYLLSSLAYQGISCDLAWVSAINSQAQPADYTFYFKVSAATAAQRRRKRGGPEEHFDALKTQQNILTAYAQNLHHPAVGTVQIVDAEASQPAVYQQLCDALDQYEAAQNATGNPRDEA